jgi:hypothetical protein
MAKVEIEIRYNTLFQLNQRYCSGRMGLDEGVKDLKAQASTLERIASNVPHKDRITVGLGNCETNLRYEEEVGMTNGNNPLEVLGYFLDLPKEDQPLRIYVSAYQNPSYQKEIETFLNKKDKTLKQGTGFLLKLLGCDYGTLVRDIKPGHNYDC